MRPYSIHPLICIFVIVPITTYLVVMGGKKGGEYQEGGWGYESAFRTIPESSLYMSLVKADASLSRKADVATQKQAAADAKTAVTVDEKWSKGAN